MVIQKITIFIAHPDDTDNYAPNFIKHLVDKGKDVFIFSFTRGEHGVGSSKDPKKDEFRGKRLGWMRTRELQKAAGYLGVPKEKVRFLEIEDGTMVVNKKAAYIRAMKILKEMRPDLILAPDFSNRYYQHPDHTIAGAMVFLAAKKLGLDGPIFLFHSIKNNFYFPVSSREIGYKATSFHKSQKEMFDTLYPLYTNIEQIWHGLHVKGYRRAEGFRITRINQPQKIDFLSRVISIFFHLGYKKKAINKQSWV
ncbi:MAG: PIG-L deacetylase family protein [Candidatus Hodarchaeota archaeon]